MSRLSEGKTIGEWTCARPLGSGGNADVWEAVHSDGRRGALKVVRDQRPGKTAYGRFVREIETLQTLTPREGVLGVLDHHLPDEPSGSDFAWLVMPVSERLRDGIVGSSVSDVVARVAEVADTLAGLHTLGLAHRDIKPDNLFWFEGRAAVGDFGLVELPDVESLHDGRIPGSFGFIADEVLADPVGSDGRSADVFALAKTLWVLLAEQDFPPQGHVPADSGAATLSRRLVVGDIQGVDLIIDRATDAVQIRLTMQQLADELRAWAAQPVSRELPIDMESALQLARSAMQETFTERDAERVRSEAFEEAYEMVRRRSDQLVQLLLHIDPSASVGAQANDVFQLYTEVSEYIGGPEVERQAHWGCKVAKGPDYLPIVLLIDFGLAVDTDGNIHLAAYGYAGHEKTIGGRSSGPHQSVAPMRSIQLGQAVDGLVQVIGDELPELMRTYAHLS